MYKLKWKALASVVVLLTPSAATFATTIIGSGVHTCGEYLTERRVHPDIDNSMIQWALGFISGTLLSLGRGQKEIDISAIKPAPMQSFLLEYCARHPQAEYYEAVDQYVFSLPVIPAK